MRISRLLRREPFGTIVEKTLGRYWSARQGRQVTVQWSQGSGVALDRGNEREIWFGNMFLNVFARQGTGPASFEVLRLEYERSLSWWKRIPQAWYVRVATSQSGMKGLSHLGFSSCPLSGESADTVILGGNHRLRLLHPATARTRVLLKDGCPRHFIDDETELRSRTVVGLAPRLLSVSAEQGWYEEEYVPGVPANRMKDGGRELSLDVLEQLRADLIEPGWENSRPGEWLEGILQRLQKQVIVRHAAGPQWRSAAEDVLRDIEAAAMRQEFHRMPVPITDTHGDLQAANIVFARGRGWLIDWESCGRRFAGYDWLTFGAECRSEGNLARSCLKIGDPGAACWRSLPAGWCGLPAWTEERKQWALAWLLEELLFAFEEREGLAGDIPQSELTALLKGARHALLEIDRIR